MNFTVTYRGKDGSRVSEVVEAADKSACFAELSRRGVSAISVVEGGVRKPARDGSSTLPKRAIFLAALVLVLVGVGVWLFSGGDAKRPAEIEKKTPKAIPAVAPAATNRTAEGKLIKRHRRPKSVQNLTASIGTLPDLPTLEKPKRVYGEINGSNIFPRALFKTREENHIAGLVSAKPGERCLLNGFMPGEEERYLASLDVPVEMDESDTPQEREMREYMIELKKELKERVAEGEKITDIVQKARDDLNELANMRDKIGMKFNLLQKEGSVEEIMQYYEEANGILAEYGMDPLKLRSNKLELYQTYMERKKQENAQKPAEAPAGDM